MTFGGLTFMHLQGWESAAPTVPDGHEHRVTTPEIPRKILQSPAEPSERPRRGLWENPQTPPQSPLRGKFFGQRSCRTKVSRIFRIFVPNFAPNFAPNFSRIFRASFRGRRRPEKIHQKSPPFFNMKFPGKHEKNIQKILLESRQSNKFSRRASRRVVPLGWWSSGTLEAAGSDNSAPVLCKIQGPQRSEFLHSADADLSRIAAPSQPWRYETADVLKGPKPRNRSKIGQKQVRGVRGKVDQKHRKTSIFDLLLTCSAPNPRDLLLTYFWPILIISGFRAF